MSLALVKADADSRWNRLKDLWASLSQGQGNLSTDERKVMELFTISSLQNYGCWCHFATFTPHRGPAQDALDGYCRTWYLNYDCLAHDYGANCDVDTQYNDTITMILDPFNTNADVVAECASRNPNNECAARACAIDADFVRSVGNNLAVGTLDMSLSGFYGFDGTNGACSTRLALGPTEKRKKY